MTDIKKLTLEEKLKLLCGMDFWRTSDANGKIKSLFLSDGPNGLRKHISEKAEPATAMPNISVLANSWDRESSRFAGATIAEDALENDVDVLLAPGVNIKRTPVCGRNFEYFSEDPYLAGELAKEYIEGVQKKGVGTSLKHYLANNAEYDRLYQSSEVDERTLREIYLPAFEKALEAKPYTVMCSYNALNGVFVSENKKAIKQVLRDELGFEGLVVSDWGAVKSPYKSVKATVDLCMPYEEGHYEKLKDAYEKGLLSDEEIDFCVQNVLDLIEKCAHKKSVTTTKEERHKNAVEIAKEGIVLLKNDGVLPLRSGKIVVSGELAKTPTLGGGGSAFVRTEYEQKPLYELIANELKDATVERARSIARATNFAHKLKETYMKAYDADTVVLVIGNNENTEKEGRDRQTLKLTKTQENHILNTAAYAKKLVVVLYAGSAIDMSAWIDQVDAVVFVGFPGEGANEAISDILTGKVSPSGKLAETFPLSLEDVPAEENEGLSALRYNEGIYVGYRYYDTFGVPVLFPFGYGLSYAKFTYSDLKIKKIGDTDFEVSYSITNDSDIDAKEVSQLYVKDVFAMVSRPEKELKGFSKDLIKAHETKRITLNLNFRSFAYYCTPMEKWQVENGCFEILVGASVDDIRLKGTVQIELPDETQQSQI